MNHPSRRLTSLVRARNAACAAPRLHPPPPPAATWTTPPGVLTWHVPSGRTYTTTPTRYPA